MTKETAPRLLDGLAHHDKYDENAVAGTEEQGLESAIRRLFAELDATQDKKRTDRYS